MEQEIIKSLIVKYNLDPSKEIVDCYLSLIKLGFNDIWLRNVCIIKEFDLLYNTDQKVMSIYLDLAIKHKNLSIESIRKVIRERHLYEI